MKLQYFENNSSFLTSMVTFDTSLFYFTGTAMQGSWKMLKGFYLSLHEKISDSHIRIRNVLYIYTKCSICFYEDIPRKPLGQA